jgi:hypothetical protein
LSRCPTRDERLEARWRFGKQAHLLKRERSTGHVMSSLHKAGSRRRSPTLPIVEPVSKTVLQPLTSPSNRVRREDMALLGED